MALNEGDEATAERFDEFEAMVEAVLRSPGDLSSGFRRAAIARAVAHAQATATGSDELPELLARFVDKVSKYAYRVTDRDVERLLAAGFSEDAIFEAIVSASVGAGISRLAIGLAALEKKG